MKVLVLSGYGINCEDETLHSFTKIGFKGKIVHINDLINSPKQLQNYQVFAIPGGFSFGDDTGSGNAMAKKIKNNLFDDIQNFLEKGKLFQSISFFKMFFMTINMATIKLNTLLEKMVTL